MSTCEFSPNISRIMSLDVMELVACLNKNLCVIDIRFAEELEEGGIPNLGEHVHYYNLPWNMSVNENFLWLPNALEILENYNAAFLVCQLGVSSGRAGELLRDHSFTRTPVFIVHDGVDGCKAMGMPFKKFQPKPETDV